MGAALLRVPVSSLRAGTLALDREAAHYLTRVHRHRVGQRFIGFDPEQALFAEGCILEIGNGRVRCEFEAPQRVAGERACRVQLIQGLGKADKPDRIVRAASELGVDGITFVPSERSAVKLGARVAARRERLRAIAVDAARQCGRPDLPELAFAADLQHALANADAQLKLVLDPAAPKTLTEAIAGEGSVGSISLLIGPEGGLSAAEQALAIERGFVACRLAGYVLRTETAALAALAAVGALLQRSLQSGARGKSA